MKPNPFEALFDRAVDVAANSYFTAGLRLNDVNEALRTYPQLMPTLDIHAQVHPPGLPLIYWTAGRVLAATPALARTVSLWFRQLECNDINLMLLGDAPLASALAGMVLPLLANMLTVWCVFKLAKDRFGDRAGLYAAALWVIVPSAVLFPGSWSLVYPCIAGLTWLAVDAGLRRRSVLWFLGAGLLLSAGTFLELGTAALGVFLALYILLRYVLARRNPLSDWRFLLPALIATLLGVFSIWIAYQLVYGVSLKQIVEAMYPIHVGYQFDRVTWIVNHPYEFAVFVGLPVFCLAIIAFGRNVKAARSGGGDALSISFLLAVIGLTLFDPARDETARTWMLFMPLAVVVASQFFAEAQSQPDRFRLALGPAHASGGQHAGRSGSGGRGTLRIAAARDSGRSAFCSTDILSRFWRHGPRAGLCGATGGSTNGDRVVLAAGKSDRSSLRGVQSPRRLAGADRGAARQPPAGGSAFDDLLAARRDLCRSARD